MTRTVDEVLSNLSDDESFLLNSIARLISGEVFSVTFDPLTSDDFHRIGNIVDHIIEHGFGEHEQEKFKHMITASHFIDLIKTQMINPDNGVISNDYGDNAFKIVASAFAFYFSASGINFKVCNFDDGVSEVAIFTPKGCELWGIEPVENNHRVMMVSTC